MEIRYATQADIPGIVLLLKTSLGESLMPKSEAYWIWKHVSNPFGASPVLLALEGNDIVGVRAFMNWQWRRGDETIHSVRAVDTATHPLHQGKGIFSKLTKECLSMCEAQGVGFVFNTPNDKSKPGYLKMGWREAGRMPLHIHIPSLGRMAWSLIGKKRMHESVSYPADDAQRYFHHPQTSLLLANHAPDLIFTDRTIPFLNWRYCDVPVQKYFAFGAPDRDHFECVVVYRLKATKLGTELRIVDILGDWRPSGKAVAGMLMERARHYNAHYITVAGFGGAPFGFFTLRNVNKGPMVTVRKLTRDIKTLLEFQNWQPSIGDLELF